MASIIQAYAPPSASTLKIASGSGYLTGIVASTNGSAATAVQVKDHANSTPVTVLKVYIPTGQPATVIQFIQENQIKFSDGLEIITNDAEVQVSLIGVK